MRRILAGLLTPFVWLALGLSAQAATYYVDVRAGDDANDGSSRERPVKTLAKASLIPLQPGDELRLAAGSVWREGLVISRSGTSSALITVGSYGDGPHPRIDAGGIAENAVEMRNVEYVALSGLELTNKADGTAIRRGVLVSAQDMGVANAISVTDLYIHDVTGTDERKDNGGIVFQALGPNKPTRFEGITVARNIIWKVDRSGIAGISDQISRARWFPSRFVVVRDNYVEDVGGDGIVVRGSDGALIEHNIVYHAARRAPGYNAGIWQWSTDNSLIQLNEAAFTHGVLDGQGFDSDYNSRWTTLLYNYSHDNEGGFLLICTPVKRDDQTNLGNVGTQARFNVSHDDRTRIFQLAGASDALIEGNVIHAGKGSDVQMVVATQWDGWSKNIAFRGNFLGAQGIARYGHERGRRGGLYLIDSGFAPAEGISFDGNIYAGNHADPPDDRNARFDINYADRASWDVPRFDPAKPDGFDAYLKRHRHWMLAMLRRELRQRPTLLTPSPTLPDQARRTVTGTR